MAGHVALINAVLCNMSHMASMHANITPDAVELSVHVGQECRLVLSSSSCSPRQEAGAELGEEAEAHGREELAQEPEEQDEY